MSKGFEADFRYGLVHVRNNAEERGHWNDVLRCARAEEKAELSYDCISFTKCEDVFEGFSLSGHRLLLRRGTRKEGDEA